MFAPAADAFVSVGAGAVLPQPSWLWGRTQVGSHSEYEVESDAKKTWHNRVGFHRAASTALVNQRCVLKAGWSASAQHCCPPACLPAEAGWNLRAAGQPSGQASGPPAVQRKLGWWAGWWAPAAEQNAMCADPTRRHPQAMINNSWCREECISGQKRCLRATWSSCAAAREARSLLAWP